MSDNQRAQWDQAVEGIGLIHFRSWTPSGTASHASGTDGAHGPPPHSKHELSQLALLTPRPKTLIGVAPTAGSPGASVENVTGATATRSNDPATQEDGRPNTPPGDPRLHGRHTIVGVGLSPLAPSAKAAAQQRPKVGSLPRERRTASSPSEGPPFLEGTEAAPAITNNDTGTPFEPPRLKDGQSLFPWVVGLCVLAGVAALIWPEPPGSPSTVEKSSAPKPVGEPEVMRRAVQSLQPSETTTQGNPSELSAGRADQSASTIIEHETRPKKFQDENQKPPSNRSSGGIIRKAPF